MNESLAFENWLRIMVADAQRDGIGLDVLAVTLLYKGANYLRSSTGIRYSEKLGAWAAETIRDGKDKLGLSDSELAESLLRAGLNCYMQWEASNRLAEEKCLKEKS